MYVNFITNRSRNVRKESTIFVCFVGSMFIPIAILQILFVRSYGLLRKAIDFVGLFFKIKIRVILIGIYLYISVPKWLRNCGFVITLV